MFSRVVFGASISLRIGGPSALSTAVLGVIFGALAGYYRALDAVISRIVDGLMIFPGLVLAILIMAAPGPKESNVILAMTILYAPRIVRVVRASVLEVKTLDFVDAARVVGLGDVRILAGHLLPNVAPLLVQVTFGFALGNPSRIRFEFSGFGHAPAGAELGNIISDGRDFVRTAPWLMVFPGVMISAAVMGLNLIGDGLRDLLDPRLRNTTRRMRLVPRPGRIVAGEILLEGQDILGLKKAEMRHIRGSAIAMIFQEPMASLNPVYTVGNQISEVLATHRPDMTRANRRARVVELLRIVGIPAPQQRVNNYPYQLSGGPD